MTRCISCCVLSLAMLVSLGLAACTTSTAVTAGLTAAQVGTTAYVRGELRMAMLLPLDEASATAHEMLESVDMPVQWERQADTKHIIRATRTGDRTVTLTLRKQSPTVTRIGIRVGLLGDEAVSILMFEQLQKLYEARYEATEPDRAEA